jgi:hypothetical protein
MSFDGVDNESLNSSFEKSDVDTKIDSEKIDEQMKKDVNEGISDATDLPDDSLEFSDLKELFASDNGPGD